jgi:gamma-glutamyltranspeptidase/glutathione hydrolase
VRDSQQNGGILSLQDLANYRIKERVPLKCSYRGYEVITAPPPGGGVTLCQMLNILEGYPAKENRDVTQLHRRLASMLFAYRDRNQYLGDPDFVTIPTSILLSKDYARSIRSNIGTKAIEPKSINADFSEKEGQHTTHYSISDAATPMTGT